MKATFEADFSNFNREVDKSVAKMTTLQKEANQVNVDLNKMVDQFSGVKVIEQANAMGLALTAIGGASHLTDEELKKVAATTAAAADRFLAFGKAVPPTMQAVIKEIQAAQQASAAYKQEVESWGPAVVTSAQAMGTASTAFGQFNSLLAAGGIHISKEVGAISELIQAAGAAAGSIGALGTTGLAVGSALAGWEVGKRIDEVVHLSDDVQYLAEALGGFARETEVAAAQQDALAAASKQAGSAITSEAEAYEVLAERQRAALRQGAPAEGEDQLKKWMGEIALVTQSGVIRQLETDLKSHNFTLQELAKWYGVSVEALRFFQRELAMTDRAVEQHRRLNEQQDREWRQQLKDQDEAIKRHTEEVKRAAEETQRWTDRVHDLERGIKDVHAGLLGLNKEEQQFSQKQLAAGGTEAATNIGMQKAQMAARGLSPTGTPLAEQTPFDVYAEDMKKLNEEVKRVTEATGDYVVAQERGRLLQQQATDKFTASMMAAAKASDDWIKSLTPRVGQGMFAEGEAITPWSTLAPKAIGVKPIGVQYAGAPAAGGITAPTTVNVSGVLDPRTINELAMAVSKAIMMQLGRPTPNA